MASWTPDHSLILSALLDDVVGTEEMVHIRQDYCRIVDCLCSNLVRDRKRHFTGSKAEGLDLPGSDSDYMTDNTVFLPIKVIQSLDEIPDTSPYSIFLMYTENVPSGFALLQHVSQTLTSHILYYTCQNMNGLRYLNSDLVMEVYLRSKEPNKYITMARQGPSVETWSEYHDKSESGDDDVLSIHCNFWPTTALEWTQRPRHFGWPKSHDISSIVDFGCHLVPVGHPSSEKKLMEWRISFSIAERTLVWSFNHVQIQCYAVMKVILKEFIKVRCSPQNQVLCSYFIKTFLFWKYETTDQNFWRSDNFRECIMYLLAEFSQYLREGVLRHYFIPRFNLLAVKLTPAAQTELLQLFDIIIQSDISIVKECCTLQNIWLEFLSINGENKNSVLHNIKKRNMLQNDNLMLWTMKNVNTHLDYVSQFPSHLRNNAINTLLSHSCNTLLKTFVLKMYFFRLHFRSLIQNGSGNKDVYKLHRSIQTDVFSYDISSSKLWYAILLMMKTDYLSVLSITNEILSSIPPFAIFEDEMNQLDNENIQLYVDMFIDSDITVMLRARKAWMFELKLRKDMTNLVPLAIQIELYFSDPLLYVSLSPFTCTYYLQFLCYHRMGQYDRRNCALQQLVDICRFNNLQHIGSAPYHTLNITGHCLLLAGERALAWDMFNESYRITLQIINSAFHKYNSARWYLQNCF